MMTGRRQQWLGVLLLGVVMAVGYIQSRYYDGSLLVSVVGDYEHSAVSYTIDDDTTSLALIGEQGGESELTIMMLYDADRVELSRIETPYHYVLQDDDMGIIRIQLQELPPLWDQTVLLKVLWDGAVESVVVSDVGYDVGDRFHTIPVSYNSLCFGNDCEHDA